MPRKESQSSTAVEFSDEKEWPPLSPQEFKQYNCMADKMDLFHTHFRNTWNLLLDASRAGELPDKPANPGETPKKMTLDEFIQVGLGFCRQLELHHNIEESIIFPDLGKKMPEFRHDNSELIDQHKTIHKGLVGMEEYLKDCRRKDTVFSFVVLKSRMESWGDVLWTHMDQEVKTLGAENVRKHWTIKEFQSKMF